jgi:hypothetical protein
MQIQTQRALYEEYEKREKKRKASCAAVGLGVHILACVGWLMVRKRTTAIST